jgi:hypothetical protein
MAAAQILPLVGVLLGASAAFLATSMNERVKARRDLDREWRLRRAESYLRFLESIKTMRVIAGQMAATLGIDDEPDPIDLDEGTRALVAANDERGIANEHVNVYGDVAVILAARALNHAVWDLDWVARDRHPQPSAALWREREEAYAHAIDDYIEAVRTDLSVPGRYGRRQIEKRHGEEQKPTSARRYRRATG